MLTDMNSIRTYSERYVDPVIYDKRDMIRGEDFFKSDSPIYKIPGA